ncbi:Aste57867_9054 [Aphanomyces stellatus]|uniref:Aste57867_9054 protein n=1 Tax=Aphanomyces stellatus TaxID=120398 RepID=A0A485KM15_9STRA|nr:hypothetical protein As57867_009018 [Aphanomyces stellatus]VFT85938.1 Aste57867_9054 [Aphanomyces stellatus]
MNMTLLTSVSPPSPLPSYPTSYQMQNAIAQQNALAFNRVIILVVSAVLLVGFLAVLTGLMTKRPAWWYARLVQWFKITDHDSTSSLLVLAGAAPAPRRRLPSNAALAINLDAWRAHQASKHVPPPLNHELEPVYYRSPETPPQDPSSTSVRRD